MLAGWYSSRRENDNYQTLQVICEQQTGVFPQLTDPTLQQCDYLLLQPFVHSASRSEMKADIFF